MSLKAAVARIVADPASSQRHWAQVLEGAELRAQEPAWGERQQARYRREAAVAKAALELIARTGRGPKSLFLGEAAAELGL